LAGRLTLAHLPPVSSEEALGTFSATGARLEACFPRLEAGGVFAAAPCLGLEAAWLRTSGDVGVAEQSNRIWLDASALAHLELGLTSMLWMDGQVGISVPFTHYSYEVSNPDAVLYETPLVAGTFGLGLGVRIP
jgi:hypothetical protein